MIFKNKSLDSEINRLTFLDLAPWDLKSEIFEEAFSNDQLLFDECKKRNLKYRFRYKKKNSILSKIIGYKKIISKIKIIRYHILNLKII